MRKAEAAEMQAGLAPRAAQLPGLGQKRIFAGMSINRWEAECHSLCFPPQWEQAGGRDEGSEVSSENLAMLMERCSVFWICYFKGIGEQWELLTSNKINMQIETDK